MRVDTKRTITLLTIVFLGLFIFSGCVGDLLKKKKVGVPQPGDYQKPQAGQEGLSEADFLRRAEKAHRDGDKEEALAKYKAFLAGFPNSNRADSVLAAIGQIYESLGRNSEAIDAYQRLLLEHPQSRFSKEAGYRLAPLLINEGQYDEASRVIGNLLSKNPGKIEEARLRILLGRAQLGNGARSQALDIFLNAYNQTDDPVDKDEALKGVKASIAYMTIDELGQAQTEYSRDFPGGYVSYALAYKLFEKGETDKAKAHLDFFTENFSGHELVKDAFLLNAAIEGKGEAPKLTLADDFGPIKKAEITELTSLEPTGPVPDYNAMDVACVLPLSDSSRTKYGQKVLAGLQLAFKTYKASTPGFKANLVVYDTKGDPAASARLVEEAAQKEKVLGIVGPLLSNEAVEAAPKAQSLSMPLITLTQKDGIPETGDYIYRIFLTPKAQAETVARYTVQVLGLTRLAILHPEDNYGRLMRDYFKAEAQRLGATIVNVVGYDPKASEFSGPIRQLAGVGKALKSVGAGRKVNVNFEAVFLPDTTKAVAMIAPQFAYHDIMTHRLLGTSLWHTNHLLSTTARYTQRAVIPTPFFSGNENPSVQKFVSDYRAETGDSTAEPGQFEAYGYDAGMLLLTLMDRYHVSTREALKTALDELKPFPGVTSRFNFDQNGEYVCEPTLLTVEGAEFKMIQ